MSGPARRDTRMIGLDGLRAVAIVSVIVWHVLVTTNFPADRLGLARRFAYTTWAGVDLFFALSGFLITTLLLREERERGAFSLARFYLRRSLRILPVFYAVFALLTLVLAHHPVFRSVRAVEVARLGSPWGLWPYALFWGNYFEPNIEAFRGAVFPGNAYLVFWSLCVEEHFYLLWPVALRALNSARSRVALVVEVCAALPVLRYAALESGRATPIGVHLMSHFRVDALLWGALAAFAVGDRRFPAARRLVLGAAGALTLVLVATGELSFRPHGSPFGIAAGLGALSAASAALVATVATRPEAALTRALDARPLRVLGGLSYAIYLVHFPALDLAKHVLYRYSRAATLTNLAALVALTTLFSAAAAWVLHRAVERPFLSLKERLSDRAKT